MNKLQSKLRILLAIIVTLSCGAGYADLGDRAIWMRGGLGLNWKPTGFTGGYTEYGDGWWDIEPFLQQVDELDAVDYIQVHLNDSASGSAGHSAPHDVIEKIMGDTIVVPRAASGADPFKEWLVAVKGRGLRTMVYVNSGCLVYGNADIATAWKDYCDTKQAVKQFIKSESYYTDADYPDRAYMFAYAEFILKEYATRYGDLIDSWCFDTARLLSENGDSVGGTDIDEQRLFEAWANAARAGNPNAAVAFNHGVGTANNPFNQTTLVADFTFGHPFGGLNDPAGTESLYNRNFSFCEKMGETDGFVYSEDNKDWNDKVMGHYDPKMSTTRWNNGSVAALTDEEFLEWNEVGLSGGAISWGVPLVHNYGNRDWKAPDLQAKDWAFDQLKYMNDRLTVSKEKYVQIRKRNAFNYCVNGIGEGNGNNVRLYGYNASNSNLMWEEIDRGNGYYSYKKKGTNYCLDGGNGGANSQNVYLWKQGANNYNQQWKKVNMSDGFVKLVKRNATGYAIDGGNGGANNQNVNLWKSGSSSQNLHWFIEYK